MVSELNRMLDYSRTWFTGNRTSGKCNTLFPHCM